jgi:hypothetical protein
MSETTTIQITERQREQLREVNDGSAKAAVAVLLEAYENDNGGEESVDVEELADQLEDELDPRTTDAFADLAVQLDRIEDDVNALKEMQDALATVEERTGRVERTLEDMGARR